MPTSFYDLAEACGANPGVACEWVHDLTGSDGIAKAVDWLVAKPLRVIVIVLIAFVLNRLVRRGIRRLTNRLIARQEAKAQEVEEDPDGRLAELRYRALEKTAWLTSQAERGKQRAQALGTVLRSIASLVIYGMAVLIILAEFDINLGPLIAGAGIAGIALGFGAQTLVRDFLSGIFMLVEDQYGVGDIVDLGEVSGVVEEINLRTTLVRDVHGTLWFVPNGEIRRVGNKSQQWARTVLDIEVAYDTDLSHAARVIKQVADRVWEEQPERATILEEPEIWGVESFGPNAVVLRLVMKVEPGEQFSAARVVRGRLKAAFDREGIEIPFPQRTVWMHTVDEPTAPAPDPGADHIPAGGASAES